MLLLNYNFFLVECGMKKIVVQNPSLNYQTIATFDQTSLQEVDVKIAQVRKYFATWSCQSLSYRIQVLEKLLQIFTVRRDEIAYVIAQEVGMPISVCNNIDIDSGLMHMKGYLQQAEVWLSPEVTYETITEIHTQYYEPFGVVGISIPWNYPFSNFIWTVIPSLLVGNTVVIKHSENCMLAAKLLEEMIQSVSELVDACQFVFGLGSTVGNHLIYGDIDYLWFIGSTHTGSFIQQAAADSGIPVLLELGGSAPAIVFEDADIDAAVASVYGYRFSNSGQSCDAIKRLLVHESIFEQFVDKLVSYIHTKKVGSALDETTDIGPLVNKRQVEMLQQQVDDALEKDAKIICGGKAPVDLDGAYYKPTILTDITFDMAVWNEEVFGPVLPVISFTSTQEAIELANDTEYGLGAYVYTQSRDLAGQMSSVIKSGNISINGTSYVLPQNPFGGYKKASGFGRVHGRFGMQNLCNIKVVATKK
ncbi:MAG: hypothetical protein CL947_04375 [Epsilonproteobacteria bacterium]|nr:hypothetical protein [Campylobacterota bacterium]|tara:strand:- start:1565 stop:2992 length:1428 start_codon:yes stop_codon:yes gene_type:complete